MSATTDQRALSATGIARSYRRGLLRRRVPVLRGVDLALEPGCVTGLVGPNGSGKSTFLRIAAGIDRPDAGTVLIAGSPAGTAQAYADSGYLPEESPFPRELRALQALRLLGDLQGTSKQDVDKRAPALLERVGLAEHGKTRLGAFSRGMLRRFGLAQAFLHRPRVVLLDEPTAGLDALGWPALEGLLQDAREAGTAVLLSTHVAADLMGLCDTVAVLWDGVIARCGSPAELLARQGVQALEVQGLDSAGLEALEIWLREQGSTLVGHGPALRPFHDLLSGEPSP